MTMKMKKAEAGGATAVAAASKVWKTSLLSSVPRGRLRGRLRGRQLQMLAAER